MVVPDYRLEFLRSLAQEVPGDLVVWCGEDYFDPTTRTTDSVPVDARRVRNRYLAGRRLAWQRGAVAPLARADIAILEMNPRVLSNWAILVSRRVRSRPTILWGHAWSRRGPHVGTNRARALMRRLAAAVVVYTERQRLELKARERRARVFAAPNALYRSDEIGTSVAGPHDTVLFAGRLVPVKKPRLLLEAFLRARDRGLPSDVRLVFAGDGPERDPLERRIAEAAARDYVSCAGHVSPERIRALYDAALVSVSPGYVGLSIVQSVSFGVPMIYPRDEPHSPEIEAAVPGFNSIEVASDDVDGLAAALLDVVANRRMWEAARGPIARDCRKRYSVERMAQGAARAVRFVQSERR